MSPDVQVSKQSGAVCDVAGHVTVETPASARSARSRAVRALLAAPSTSSDVDDLQLDSSSESHYDSDHQPHHAVVLLGSSQVDLSCSLSNNGASSSSDNVQRGIYQVHDSLALRVMVRVRVCLALFTGGSTSQCVTVIASIRCHRPLLRPTSARENACQYDSYVFPVLWMTSCSMTLGRVVRRLYAGNLTVVLSRVNVTTGPCNHGGVLL